LAHGYRSLQQWNQWLGQEFLGQQLLASEQALLAKTKILKRHFGKHALLVGVPKQHSILESTSVPCHSLLTPLVHHQDHAIQIEGDFHHLPLLTGSIDLVILPHTLELIDTPRQLLTEACRIVKPEGLIVIFGFNPHSMWGARRLLTRQKITPWSGNFLKPQAIKHWLNLAEFALEKQKTILYRPPVKNKTLYDRFQFIERMGQYIFPLFGGVYMIVARAKVIPLTPIRMKWKQQLSGIRIFTSMTGHIARQSK